MNGEIDAPPSPADSAGGAAARPDITPSPGRPGAVPGMTPDGNRAGVDWLRREGLPPQGLFLIPAMSAPPMRQPDHAWAMLVLAVDTVHDPDQSGEVGLFAGCWTADPLPAHQCEGDLVLVLTAPGDDAPDDRVDVELLLAHRHHWRRVGRWAGLDRGWPGTVACTAAAVLSLHTDVSDAAAHHAALGMAAWSVPPWRGWGGNMGVLDLLAAGLVRVGEELIWDCPGHGARHTARIEPDGRLRLADGRIYAAPTGAASALGGRHQNGWVVWRRALGGRTLAELRADLAAQAGASPSSP